VRHGRETRTAIARRRQWLIAEGLAQEEQGCVAYRANLLAVPRRRELNLIARQLLDALGKAKPGERIEDIYRRPSNWCRAVMR